MNNAVYYILGALLLLYFIIAMYNRRQGKKRKSRSFMEGQRLRDRREKKTPDQ